MGKIKKRAIKSPTLEKQKAGISYVAEWPSEAEYISLFNNCVINKEHIGEIDRIIDRKMLPNRDRYEAVAIRASSQISVSDLSPFRILQPGSIIKALPGNLAYIQDLLRNTMDDGSLHFAPYIQQQITHQSLHINSEWNVGSFRLTAHTGRIIPWYVIAVIHNMEGGCNFNVHIHNGDALTGYTTHRPSGHPKVGHPPPFTWEESAIDALVTVRHFNRVLHWNLPRILSVIEEYNGTAYRLGHRFTPYLWSYSNLFVKGKFVADHKFDANAGSAQAGAATVLKRMEQRNLIYIPRW